MLYFFLARGNISLSYVDQRFLSNLQNIIHNTKQVTSNQAKLFDKLVGKYQRQLAKHDLDNETLLQLPWRSRVIESLPEFTGARVDCINGVLNLRVPFNKSFIAYREENMPAFTWNKAEKMYTATFSMNNLKTLYKTLPEFFKPVMYAPELHNLINEIEQYKDYLWEPTLIDVNGYLVIGAATNDLLNGIKHIELNKSAKTLCELSSYGVTIGDSITNNNPKLKFASERYVQVDLTQVEQMIGWLKELGISTVSYGKNDSRHTTSYPGLQTRPNTKFRYEKVKDILDKHGINVYEDTRDEKPQALLTFYSFMYSSIYLKSSSQHIKKVIRILDSTPVDVK